MASCVRISPEFCSTKPPIPGGSQAQNQYSTAFGLKTQAVLYALWNYNVLKAALASFIQMVKSHFQVSLLISRFRKVHPMGMNFLTFFAVNS